MIQEKDSMKYQRLFLLCCIFIATFLPQASHACTTFCLDTHDELVVGQNFDWINGDALIILIKKECLKNSLFTAELGGGRACQLDLKIRQCNCQFPWSGISL